MDWHRGVSTVVLNQNRIFVGHHHPLGRVGLGRRGEAAPRPDKGAVSKCAGRRPGCGPCPAAVI